MSDHTLDDSASAFTTRDDRIETTARLNGEDYPIVIRDVTIDELEALEDLGDSGEMSDFDEFRHVIGEYLVEPDIDPNEIQSPRKLTALFTAMVRAWGGTDEARAALSDLELPEGNG